MSLTFRLFTIALIAPLFIQAGGCASVAEHMENLAGRNAYKHELMRRQYEHEAAMREACLEEKLAQYEDSLARQSSQTETVTATTLGMELNHSLDMQDIEVDVDELKNVITRAEARARAEKLRLQRAHQLHQDQQRAIQNAYPSAMQSTQDLQKAIRPVSTADMVVGVDEYGNSLPIDAIAPKPTVAPAEIPYVVRLRVNLGLNQPRVEDVRVRRVAKTHCANPCSRSDCDHIDCARQPTVPPLMHAANGAGMPISESPSTRIADFGHPSTTWPTSRLDRQVSPYQMVSPNRGQLSETESRRATVARSQQVGSAPAERYPLW